MEEFGVKVLRFSNEKVNEDMDEIIKEIQNQIVKRKMELHEENKLNSLPRP